MNAVARQAVGQATVNTDEAGGPQKYRMPRQAHRDTGKRQETRHQEPGTSVHHQSRSDHRYLECCAGSPTWSSCVEGTTRRSRSPKNGKVPEIQQQADLERVSASVCTKHVLSQPLQYWECRVYCIKLMFKLVSHFFIIIFCKLNQYNWLFNNYNIKNYVLNLLMCFITMTLT